MRRVITKGYKLTKCTTMGCLALFVMSENETLGLHTDYKV